MARPSVISCQPVFFPTQPKFAYLTTIAQLQLTFDTMFVVVLAWYTLKRYWPEKAAYLRALLRETEQRRPA